MSSAGTGRLGYDDDDAAAVELSDRYCVYDVCIAVLLRGAVIVCDGIVCDDDDDKVAGSRPFRPIILRRNSSIT